jgi:hypothetical protein
MQSKTCDVWLSNLSVPIQITYTNYALKNSKIIFSFGKIEGISLTKNKIKEIIQNGKKITIE